MRSRWLLTLAVVAAALLGSSCINVDTQRFPGRKDCSYQGARYSVGSRLCQGGVVMLCEDGSWRATSEQCS